jgi:hypothetical protein
MNKHAKTGFTPPFHPYVFGSIWLLSILGVERLYGKK